MHSSNGNAKASAYVSIDDDISQLSESQSQRCIYKVHKHLRDINEKAYEPEIIAIGPYHHGNKDTYKMMEEHKLRYLDELFRYKDQDLGDCTLVIEKLEKRARDCYSEHISLDQAEFIKMLVLDGCFIIELIKRYGLIGPHPNNNDPVFQTEWILNSLQRDLILFENQIPFFVLCELFDFIEAPNNEHNMLIYLILNFFQNLYPGKAELEFEIDRELGEVKHLLDLIHTNWMPSSNYYVYLNSINDIEILDREKRFFHSATELKDANVTFRKRESNTLFDVDFKKGKMVMPQLIIEDRTECILRNLIAYEQYFPVYPFNFVTEYVKLMDCLINSVKDVEILSGCGIIDNRLGDNEVVARIFNQLTISVTGAAKHFMYTEMALRINKHYRRPWNRAMAVLSRDYFKSPWAYITFFSAVILLGLTVAQTVFSALYK